MWLQYTLGDCKQANQDHIFPTHQGHHPNRSTKEVIYVRNH